MKNKKRNIYLKSVMTSGQTTHALSPDCLYHLQFCRIGQLGRSSLILLGFNISITLSMT